MMPRLRCLPPGLPSRLSRLAVPAKHGMPHKVLFAASCLPQWLTLTHNSWNAVFTLAGSADMQVAVATQEPLVYDQTSYSTTECFVCLCIAWTAVTLPYATWRTARQLAITGSRLVRWAWWRATQEAYPEPRDRQQDLHRRAPEARTRRSTGTHGASADLSKDISNGNAKEASGDRTEWLSLLQEVETRHQARQCEEAVAKTALAPSPLSPQACLATSSQRRPTMSPRTTASPAGLWKVKVQARTSSPSSWAGAQHANGARPSARVKAMLKKKVDAVLGNAPKTFVGALGNIRGNHLSDTVTSRPRRPGRAGEGARGRGEAHA